MVKTYGCFLFGLLEIGYMGHMIIREWVTFFSSFIKEEESVPPGVWASIRFSFILYISRVQACLRTFHLMGGSILAATCGSPMKLVWSDPNKIESTKKDSNLRAQKRKNLLSPHIWTSMCSSLFLTRREKERWGKPSTADTPMYNLRYIIINQEPFRVH